MNHEENDGAPSYWAIGDVHGCHRTLLELLQHIKSRPGEHHFLFVGDLVGKGPSSGEVVETVIDLGDDATTVLGNHDLHLLAVDQGVATSKESDRHLSFLSDPRKNRWIDWLIHCPLACQVSTKRDTLIVHAGIDPAWDQEETLDNSGQLSDALRRGDFSWYRDDHSPLGYIASILTRLRGWIPGTGPAYGFSGAPETHPPGTVPWFKVENRATASIETVTGHWATLGFHRHQRHTSIDTGCVYGGELLALSLDTKETIRCQCHAVDAPRRD